MGGGATPGEGAVKCATVDGLWCPTTFLGVNLGEAAQRVKWNKGEPASLETSVWWTLQSYHWH